MYKIRKYSSQFQEIENDRKLLHQYSKEGNVEEFKKLIEKYNYSSFINSIDYELEQVFFFENYYYFFKKINRHPFISQLFMVI